MKVTLYYNFDEMYHEGPDSIVVNKKNVPFTVSLTKSDQKLTFTELYNKYKKSALDDVVYDMMKDYADTI